MCLEILAEVALERDDELFGGAEVERLSGNRRRLLEALEEGEIDAILSGGLVVLVFTLAL